MRLSPLVRQWFAQSFEAPTQVQEAAWNAILDRKNVLAVAPTGSGKTLAAFLCAIDRLMSDPPAAKGVVVLYVSPLKALAADVEKNLRRPLAELGELAASGAVDLGADGAAGAPAVLPSVAMRTGDTPPRERARIKSKPPQILITTPESLYLMLTSQAASVLSRVETVIVDEIHSIANSKRGAHLALSLERLDALLERPAQRVGLSATVQPVKEVARFLGGAHPVEVAGDSVAPAIDLAVRIPVANINAVPEFLGTGAPKPTRAPAAKDAWKTDRSLKAAMGAQAAEKPAPSGQRASGASQPKAPQVSRESRVGSRSIWPSLEAELLSQVESHTSTLVFVNSRGLCERLTARLNERHAQEAGLRPAGAPIVEGAFRGSLGSPDSHTEPLPEGAEAIARAHHGSVSKERRLAIESELKAGSLPCVVATSSLELGIDMGSVDLVCQVAPPLSVASGLQRIGRANHRVGGRSRAILYPRTKLELIDCAVMAEAMLAGDIEATRLVKNPLDVLAQQTVAAVSQAPQGLRASQWFSTVRRAANFSELPREAFDRVLAMLAGAFATDDLESFAPRLVWDQAEDLLTPLPVSGRMAISSAGTIPDRGLYPVFTHEAQGRQGRRRVGELDEEMVHESRVGDVITLGTTTWRITEISNDRVLVKPAKARASRLPFWHGEGPGRPYEDGLRKGEFLAAASSALQGAEFDEGFRTRLAQCGMEADAIGSLGQVLARQRAATGVIPSGQSLVIELVEDEVGDTRLLLHSPFGRAVHAPWALAVADRIERLWGYDPEAMAADDGILLRLSPTAGEVPGPETFIFEEEELRAAVQRKVASTSLFAARFRECAARALLMRPSAFGKRAPLWAQRLQASQLLEQARQLEGFPMVLEALRECLQDVYDLDGLAHLMGRLRSKQVAITQVATTTPSPFAGNLLFGYVMEHLYDADKPQAERSAALLSIDPALLADLLGSPDLSSLIDPAVLRQLEAQLQWLASGHKATSPTGLARLLRALGPLRLDEIARRCDPANAADAWLAQLAQEKQVFQGAVAGQPCWIAATDGQALHQVLGLPVPSWAPAAPPAALAADKPAAQELDALVGLPLSPAASSFDANPAEKPLLSQAGLSTSAATAQKPGHFLDALVARYAGCHGPFSTQAAAASLGLGAEPVADALERLSAQDRLLRGDFGIDELEEPRQWVSAAVFKRLRKRSLAAAHEAMEPVGMGTYLESLWRLQEIPAQDAHDQVDPLDLLASAIALYEGVWLEAGAWEQAVFPARVPGYKPALLNELLASGEVVWQGRRTLDAAQKPSYQVAFFPTDSPFAPLPLAAEAAATGPDASDDADAATRYATPTPPQRADDLAATAADNPLWQTMSKGGGWSFSALKEACATVAAGRDEAAPSSADIQAQLEDYLWGGLVLVDSFGPVRTIAQPAKATKAAPVRRRSRSRYGRASASRAPRPASVPVDTALSGHWSLAQAAEATDTERALALVQSVLDRYGVLTPEVARAAAIPGGLSQIYPALRALEDTGTLWRGQFVDGLGPLQYATPDFVEALRASAAEKPAPAVPASPAADVGATDAPPAPLSTPDAAPELRVLSATDPAQPLGALFPWPASAEKPTRRADAHCVFADGAPVLYASAHLKSIYVYMSAEDDEQVDTAAPSPAATTTSSDDALAAHAIQALLAAEKAAALRQGLSWATQKIEVEQVNDHPVLKTRWTHVLASIGFVRTPSGMRFYPDPL